MNWLLKICADDFGSKPLNLVKAIGYKNVSKGLRKFDLIVRGQMQPDRFFMDGLAAALNIPVETVEACISADFARRVEEAAYQHEEGFLTHAVILTEHVRPRPLIVAALVCAERFLRIDFDPVSSPLTFPAQVVRRLPEGVPCFGRTVGFVINYTLEKAVKFDSQGNAMAVLHQAYRYFNTNITV